MGQDQNQGQRKGPIDYANNIANDLLNLRRGVPLIRAAAFIGPTLGWIGAITGIALLFTVGIGTLIFLGGVGLGAETSNPFTSNKNIDGLFNITGATTGQTQQIYNALQDAMNYPLYKKLLTGAGPVNISLDTDRGLKDGLCGGSVVNGNITLFNFFTCAASGRRYLLLHETGHTIGNRNADLYHSFPYSQLKASDSSCYSPAGFLKTYAEEFGNLSGPFNESFAEAVSLFISYKDRPPLNNFPTQCPATYNWIRANVYQGGAQ